MDFIFGNAGSLLLVCDNCKKNFAREKSLCDINADGSVENQFCFCRTNLRLLRCSEVESSAILELLNVVGMDRYYRLERRK